MTDEPGTRVPSPISWNFILTALALTLTSGVLWAAVIPIWQTPDEPAHFAYAQNIGEGGSPLDEAYLSRDVIRVIQLAEYGSLRLSSDATQPFTPKTRIAPAEYRIASLSPLLRKQRDRSNPADSYPPGYYVVSSIAYRLLRSYDTLSISFALRLFSVMLTMGTVVFHYLTLRWYFNDEAYARTATLLIVLSPMYMFMGMAVNVDVLVWFLFSIFFYVLTRALREGLTRQHTLAMSLVISLGLLVKQTFLAPIVFYLILLTAMALKRELRMKEAAFHLATLTAILIVVDGWLYLGGFIHTSLEVPPEYFTQAGQGTRPPGVGGYFGHFVDRWRDYLWTLDTYWGNFGWLDTPVSGALANAFRLITAVGFVGLLAYITRTVAVKRADIPTVVYLSIFLMFLFLFTVVNYARITSGEGWFLQGRYFFPAIAIAYALVLQGLTWLLRPAWRQRMLLLLTMGMLLFHVQALLAYILPRFYL